MAGQRLLERERELGLIEEAIGAAASGDGRLVAFEGEAGIGKTSLLEVAARVARGRGFRVLGARGTPHERSLGFGIARQLFETSVVRAPESERRAALAGSASLAAPVLGLDQAGPAEAARQMEEFSSLHGLYWLVCNLAESSPLLLLVDDAQCSDEASLRWLLYLAQRLEGLRVVVLVAVRSHEPEGERRLLGALVAQPGVRLLRPAPLSVAATGVLLERAIGADVEPRFSRACWEWTRGNPWFLAEVATELTAAAIGPDEEGLEHLRGLTPEGLARVTLMRLDRLPGQAIELARAVAVLGPGAELREAAALAGLEAGAAVAAHDRLIGARVLEAGRPVAFVHPLVRGIVYEGLPPARRAADHKRAARQLDRDGAALERIVPHLLAGAPAGEEWVVERLRAAAAAELAHGSPAAAAGLLERALEEPPARAARPGLLFELGRARFLARDPAAIEPLEQALAVEEVPGRRNEVALMLGRLLIFAGRARAAIDVVEAVIAEEQEDDRRLELEALRLAAARSDIELVQVAEEQARRIREGPRPRSRGGRIVNAHLAYQAAIAGDAATETVALCRLALEGGHLLRESRDSPDFTVPISMLAICDELEEAESHYAEAIELTRSRGCWLGFVTASCMRGWASHLRGRLADSELESRDALAIASAHASLEAIGGFATAHLMEALIERGALAEAEALSGGERRDGGGRPMTWSRSLLFAEGRLRAARGQVEEAAELLLECGRLHDAAAIVNPAFLPWRSEASLTLHRLGRRAEALRLADEELALARRFGARRPIGVALRTRGAVEGGAAGLRLLEESVVILRKSPAALERARSTVALGAALRRAGRRSQGREALAEGLEMAVRCGATPLAEEARAELRLLGSRPRSELRHGVDALTPAERRVAEMAATGMSNPAIAQSLFVTRATVESHLHAAYRKLGIGSREQLGGALGESQ